MRLCYGEQFYTLHNIGTMLMSHGNLLFVACLSVCCGDLALGTFFSLAPNEFRPGWPLTVAATAHQTAAGKVFVNCVLGPCDDIIDVYSSVADSLSPGETKLLTIEVPEMVLPAGSDACLTVTTSGSVIFNSTKNLKYNPTSSLVFVETDKAIYKPGQTIHFRVVHVGKDLKPIIKPLTVFIVNPKDSKLEEYKDIASRTGVAELTYGLLKSASLGKWKIEVKDDANMLYTKEFTVEEYVLPKFSVQVKANPGYIVLENKNAGSVVTVEAVYTYGKGVQGNCTLAVSPKENSWSIKYTKQLDHSGKAEFSDVNWKKFTQNHFEGSGEVLVTAVVADETGRTEAGQTVVKFHKYNTKIEILPKSTRVLRRGIPANIFIRVSDHDGNPVDNAEVNLHINVHKLNEIHTKLSVPKGETDVSYDFTPGDSEPSSSSYHMSNRLRVELMSNTDIQSVMSAYLYSSLTSSFIAVEPVSEEITAVGGIVYKVLISTQHTPQTVSYVVVSQGIIVQAGNVINNTVSITPTLEMCPQAKLLVYMVVGQEEPEVVSDVLDISPTRCFGKEVRVSFDAAEIRSGADTTMKVRVDRKDGSNALPGVHNVYYLGIDKSLVLLQGSSSLDKKAVLTEMSNLNLQSKSLQSRHDVVHSADDMIEGMGLIVFTTMPKYNDNNYEDFSIDNWDYYSYLSGNGDYETAGVAFDDMEGILHMHSPTTGQKEQANINDRSDPVSVKVRKSFPETWLWGHGTTDMNGHWRQTVTLPDTITTWLVSAFAINDEGLAVGSGPFQLAAFQIFFSTMNLPYSIKRGEVFALRITVFNYRKQDINVNIRLAASSQFSILDTVESVGWYQKIVAIPANRASSVDFKINATTIGLIELHAVAEDVTDGLKDEVKRSLLVKPEGEMRSEAITKVLFLKSETTITDKFSINWPEDRIVPGSKRVEVKITGNMLGQSLSNLQNLVMVPCGCGEQNMITTVPNIYGLTYIRTSGLNGNPELENEMLNNMKYGYQRQVDMYRHKDGSYSAWGESDTSNGGSVWLTAFVLKSFSQAAEFMTVDPNVLTSGASFLISKQEKSGAFVETGQVFHSEMQSGTGSGLGLTVYVLISLLETDQAAGGELLSLQKQIDQAVVYVKEKINPAKLAESRDKYLAAMSAYALALLSDSRSVSLLNELLAVVTDLGAPWEEIDDIRDSVSHYYYISRPPSRNIETTAYYLLALNKLGRLEEAVEIMKWLQSKQNSLGGYHSTQDTIMALQALSEFGVAFKLSANMVNVKDPDSGQSFDVQLQGSRSLLLQTVELPESTKTVHVTVSGPANSFCVVKVVYTYYTLPGDIDTGTLYYPGVSIETKSSHVSHIVHKVQVCIKSSKSLKYNGMFVTTLALPSGEEAFDDQPTVLANNPKVSRVETGQGVIHFYMNEPPGDGYCLYAHVERQMEFQEQKPGSAKIYAYYEPDISQEVALSLIDSLNINDGAITLDMTNIFLTLAVCTLINLLLCM